MCKDVEMNEGTKSFVENTASLPSLDLCSHQDPRIPKLGQTALPAEQAAGFFQMELLLCFLANPQSSQLRPSAPT